MQKNNMNKCFAIYKICNKQKSDQHLHNRWPKITQNVQKKVYRKFTNNAQSDFKKNTKYIKKGTKKLQNVQKMLGLDNGEQSIRIYFYYVMKIYQIKLKKIISKCPRVVGELEIPVLLLTLWLFCNATLQN